MSIASNKKYIIKNKENETIASIDNCGYLRNAIGAKLKNGGYYIAVSSTSYSIKKKKLWQGKLNICKFDKYGNFEKIYVYDEYIYSFYLDFLFFDDYIALIACNDEQIETYKLTSDGCYLWNISNIKLDKFIQLINATNCIDHTIDNSTIIVSTYNKANILNFNSTNGEVSIINKIENEEKINRFAFSNTDKYFLLIDNDELKAYKYNKNFDYKFEKPYLAYPLTSVEKNDCNSCYEMAIGTDGKLYIFKRNNNKLIILNGIETGNINIETITISNEFSSYDFLPRIPRKPFLNTCKAYAEFNNSFVCNNQPLKILSEGTAPYEISYTLNGIEKTITTSEQEYTMPDIVGKYKISKIKDANCEFEPTHNNTSEIVQKIKKPTIEYK